MFSKNCFSKEFAIFSSFFRRFFTGFTGISPVGHVIPTGRKPAGPDRYNFLTGRTGPVYNFPTGSSSGRSSENFKNLPVAEIYL
jgi:hypothetical protein